MTEFIQKNSTRYGIFNWIAFVLLILSFGSGCQNIHTDSLPPSALIEESQTPGAELSAPEIPQGTNAFGPPNESGKVMVLMYHNVGPEEEEWVRTPANFRKDLQTLYDQGYRPISLTDYVTGKINTPRGYTPVVLTFDDGNRNNFEYLEDGSISSQSAVGILLDFHQTHPDFPLEATFFLTGDEPFGQKGRGAEKVAFLLDQGMDVGNHTKTHPNFKHADGTELQAEIGGQAQQIQTLIQDRGYQVNTLALPFGVRPEDSALRTFLESGSEKGISYKNIAVLNVGWMPALSPYDPDFDPTSIPRVRASETKVDGVGLYDYLSYFQKHPEQRFISDGEVVGP